MQTSKLIICNWKMNGNIALVDAFLNFFNDGSFGNGNLVMGFPDIFLAYARSRSKNVKLAAQDCSVYSDFGAYTGETSAKMLNEIGVEYIIIGHSERRIAKSDSSQTVYEKLKNVVQNNMTAILCVDEHYERLLDEKTIELLKSNPDKIILAYEPLASIGTGVTPAISEIQKAIDDIRGKYFNLKAIYGGSVNSKNAGEILGVNELYGVLIGGASLKLDEMKKIIIQARGMLCSNN
ncbi:MAG: triose-phosphate isomerase [Holosporales bacterium]|jgi:triosephosphate isomerase|nr:triose-phosphate isomerase [Holosporales bacterium]